MKHIIAVILFLLLFLPTTYGQTSETDDSVRISLLTCSPGEELYSLFGHTAIRYEDPKRGIDVVFNYGLFSFRTPNFALRFALGETDYMLGAEDYDSFISEYMMSNRSVWQQTLNLTREEKAKLIGLLEENYRPENRMYRYNFFYDNCATRPRDKIKESIDGTVVYPDLEQEPVSFRDIVYRFTKGHSWARFGFNLCLGVEADQPVTNEQMMFVPEYLKEAFAKTAIETNEGSHPLVASTSTLFEQEPQEETGTEKFTPFAVALLLLLICIFQTLKDIQRRKGCWPFDLLLFAVAGLAGCILAFLALFSSHPTVDRNYVLFVFHPGHLFFLPYIINCIRKGKKCWYLAANAVVLTLFIAFSRLIPQEFESAIVPLALCLLIRSASNLIITYRKKA